jgi:hypothetical protein
MVTDKILINSRKDTKQLVNDIVFGDLRKKKKVSVSTPNPHAKRNQTIIDKQREIAEQKAVSHILNVERPYQYAFVELEHKPDLPLDNIQWGNPATNYVPMSHYNSTFMDPKIMA